MMKLLVVLLGLTIVTLPSGATAATVRIRAYTATGKLNFGRDPFTLGTRVLLTCDVTGLSDQNEVVSYRWYHNCTRGYQGRCQIRNRDPYYRVVSGTLLVDVTSWDQGGTYSCFVRFTNLPQSGKTISIIAVAGNPAPFLYTPTSLLPEHSVLTDVQQATGRNGQKWIKCRIGRDGGPAEIHGNVPINFTYSSVDQTATLGLMQSLPQNGHYNCMADERTHDFDLFLRKHSTLPRPSLRRDNTGELHIGAPDGSQVERYIVEFECGVRNMTFVERYMSVSAGGESGRVATSVSCFGGLGQLYRVKVWAVSEPNISQAVLCIIPDGQCNKEEYPPAISSLELPVATPTVGSEEEYPATTSSLELPGANCAGDREEDSPFQPIVVAAITAANTLLLLASLATYIGSCTVLKRAKQGRQQDKINLPENDNHIYETVDDVAKGQMVKAESEDTNPVYADVNDLPPLTRPHYQTPQMHSRDKPM